MHILLYSLLNARLVVSDLPVHCERSDYIGQWRFTFYGPTNSYPLDFGDAPSSYCSAVAGRPTQNSDLLRQVNSANSVLLKVPPPSSTIPPTNVYLTETQSINHSEPDYARHQLLAVSADTPLAPGDAPARGFWTPTFDQGFEVRIAGKSLLAISRYTCADAESVCVDDDRAHESSEGEVRGWHSECGSTFLGWWHDNPSEGDASQGEVRGTGAGKSWGCFIGERVAVAAAFPASLRGRRVSLSFAQVGTRVLTNPSAISGLPISGDSCNSDAAVEDEEAYKALPQSFDWRGYFSSVTNPDILEQGNCGSCYAVSAVYALQMRTNIGIARILGNSTKHWKPISVSAQAAVSCGHYTQGCNGGLEMLVHRFAQESGLPDDQCMAYEGKLNSVCKAQCYTDERRLVFAKDYGYVGGLYGLCSETRIMRNIFERGPLTVAIHTRDSEIGRMGPAPVAAAAAAGSFMEETSPGEDIVGVKLSGWPMSSVMVDLAASERLRKYFVKADGDSGASEVAEDNKTGVLFVKASMVNREWAKFKQELIASLKENSREGVTIVEAFGVGIHTWRYIDHSVAVLGWGSQPEPYWLIRNSWADDLPGGGYTKIKRGQNKGQVESAAVWVEPDLCRGQPREILNNAGKLHLVC